MTAYSSHSPVDLRNEKSGTIVWLTGWSMPDSVFDHLRVMLPDFHHVSVLYYDADSPEKMLNLTEAAVSNLLFDHNAANKSKAIHGPLIIAGWSLGSLLALKLAAKGYADCLVLIGATAKFIRSKEEQQLGWADAYIRQMIRGIEKDRQAVETSFRQLLFTELESQTGNAGNLPPIGIWSTPALISGLQILRTEDILSQSSKIHCPVLMIHGMEDKICYYNAAYELKENLRKVKLVTLPSCGHMPFLGEEAFIGEKLRRWWHEQQHN